MPKIFGIRCSFHAFYSGTPHLPHPFFSWWSTHQVSLRDKVLQYTDVPILEAVGSLFPTRSGFSDQKNSSTVCYPAENSLDSLPCSML